MNLDKRICDGRPRAPARVRFFVPFDNRIFADTVSRGTVAETDAKMNELDEKYDVKLYNGETISRYEYACAVEYMQDSELWKVLQSIIHMQVQNARDVKIEEETPLFGHTDDIFTKRLLRQNAKLHAAAKYIADCIDEEFDYHMLNAVDITEMLNALKD